MNMPIHQALRAKRMPQRVISLFNYSECVIFILVLLYKLTLFDRQMHVPLVQMGRTDYVIAIGSILLCSFWVWFLPRRGRWLSLTILNAVISLIIFADMVYFRYFQDFISIPVLLQARQVSSLGDSIHSLLAWKDVLFFADLVIWIPVTIIFWRKLRRDMQAPLSFHRPVSRWKKPAVRFCFGFIVLIIGLYMTFVPIRQASNTWAKGLFVGNWWNVSIYNVTGLLGFHGYDVYQYVHEHLLSKQSLSDEDMARVQEWFDQLHAQAAGPKNELFGAYKGKNVMVIQAEAFQNFFIGKSMNGQEITPNLNQLIQESMYFPNYYHQTGQGRTSDADFSANTALHALPTGSIFIRYPTHTYDSLPQILKDHGYTSNVFHAYDASFWNRYNMYQNLGYDRFYSKKDYTIDEPLGWSLGDMSFFRQSLNAMEQLQQPFYSFMITLSSHHPYDLPASKQKLDVGEFKDTIFGNYLEAVHYVDEAMGSLIQQMKADGLWESTIIAFYGDHDNSIRDKAVMEKFLGTPISDVRYDQMMNQVPLIVHFPDDQHAGIVEHVGGQLDLAPSLLYLLGISTADKYMMGNNLFTEDDKLVVLRNGTVTDGSIYYIPSADGVFEHGTCYDLNTDQPIDTAKCQNQVERGRTELSISDQVVTFDVIQTMRNRETAHNS